VFGVVAGVKAIKMLGKKGGMSNLAVDPPTVETGNATESMQSIQCFIEGTLVLCKDENDEECHKKIENIEVGDLVWAYDEGSGECDWKPVVQLFRGETEAWCKVVVKSNDGTISEITSTPGHKYFLRDNEKSRELGELHEHLSYVGLSEKWVSAKNLKQGDKVLLAGGQYGIVEKVEVRNLDKSETTYNFEVTDFHTYFVGEGSVCVHNFDCGVSSPNQMQQEVLRGQAPRGVESVHSANTNVVSSKPHVHFKDGTSLNWDGSIHDALGGTPKLTKKIRTWLTSHGWGTGGF